MSAPGSWTAPFADLFRNFSIRPETNWARAFNPQFMFVLNRDDAEVETEVLRQVGSYGKQLSTIIDAIDVLVRHQRGEAPAAGDERSLSQFDALRSRAREVVDLYEPDRIRHQTAELASHLERLRDTDHEQFNTVVKPLRDVLARDKGPTPRDSDNQ
jgi:hypothetical protein